MRWAKSHKGDKCGNGDWKTWCIFHSI